MARLFPRITSSSGEFSDNVDSGASPPLALGRGGGRGGIGGDTAVVPAADAGDLAIKADGRSGIISACLFSLIVFSGGRTWVGCKRERVV